MASHHSCRRRATAPTAWAAEWRTPHSIWRWRPSAARCNPRAPPARNNCIPARKRQYCHHQHQHAHAANKLGQRARAGCPVARLQHRTRGASSVSPKPIQNHAMGEASRRKAVGRGAGQSGQQPAERHHAEAIAPRQLLPVARQCPENFATTSVPLPNAGRHVTVALPASTKCRRKAPSAAPSRRAARQ